MHHYDIRILKSDCSVSLAFEGAYISDHSAIRAAKTMADGKAFEVWRGMECIYGRSDAPHPVGSDNSPFDAKTN